MRICIITSATNNALHACGVSVANTQSGYKPSPMLSSSLA